MTIDLALIAGLSLFIGLIMFYQYDSKLLYHDNWSFYGLFRDQLHSLNRYGEIGWWAPHYQLGWPAYYYAILGDNNCTGPVFVFWGFAAWLAGRLGIHSDSFYLLYLINYAFVVPLLAMFAAYAVLRQLFRNRTVIRFALILAAMSPAVLQSPTTSSHLEQLTYGLSFLAAYLYFLRRPSRRSFWLLGLTTCVLALTFNHPSLLDNAILLPASVAVITFVPRRGWRRLWSAARSVPPWHFAALAVCVAICFIPVALAVSQGKDIIRVRSGSQEYGLDDMVVGNPLIGLIASTPYFGFQPAPGSYGARVNTMAASNNPLVTQSGEKYTMGLGAGYYYMGLLCLPLVCVALSSARPRVRRQLFILLAVFYGMMCLVAYSPIWALLLRAVKLLRTNDHFHTSSCISAGSCLFVVAAAAGMQVLLEDPRGTIRRRVQILFCLFAAISIGLHVAVLGQRVFAMPTFGFLLLLVFLYVPVLGWLRAGPRGRRRGTATAYLLFLVFLDLGTFSYIYLRELRALTPFVHKVEDKLLPDKVGFESNWEEQANIVLRYRQLQEMLAKDFNPSELPAGVFSLNAHVCGDVADEKARLERAKSESQPTSIALDEHFANLPEFAPFLSDQAARRDSPSLRVGNAATARQGYNALTIKVSTSRPCLLFLRDAYSPYWSAEVNAQPVPIARAWFNFQAVPLPAGACEIHLRFSPPLIGQALLSAYLVLFGMAGLCWYYRPRGTGLEAARPARAPHTP